MERGYARKEKRGKCRAACPDFRAAPADTKPAKKERSDIPNGFVKIAGGKFVMGSPEYEGGREANSADETPHNVTLDAFYMGKFAVAVADFARFVEATGYATIAERGDQGSIFIKKKLEKTKGVNWKKPHFQKAQKQEKDHPAIVLTF